MPCLSLFSLLSLLALMAMPGQPAWSQPAGGDLQIRVGNGAELVGQEGQRLTFPVHITALRSSAIGLRLQVVGPEGWQAITGDIFDVPPGGETTRLVTLLVPSGLAPATYAFAIELVRTDTGGLAGSYTGMVRVAESEELHLEFLRTPERLTSGALHEQPVLLRNEGNVPVAIDLKASTDQAWAAEATPSRLTLQPGESRTITVAVQVPPALERRTSVRLEVQATIGSRYETAIRTAFIEVFPRSRQARLVHHTFPLNVGLGASAYVLDRDVLATPALSLRGSGSLHEASETMIEVDIEAQPFNKSRYFAMRDRYYVGVTDPHFEVVLGDITRSLGRLSNASVSGFGGGGAVRLAGWEVGGFGVTNRYGFLDDRRFGGSLSYQPFSFAETGVHYVARQGYWETNLVAGRTLVNWDQKASASLEYGVASNGQGRTDGGYTLNATGRLDWGSASFTYLDEGAAFSQFNADRRLLSAMVSVRPLRRFNLSGSYRTYDFRYQTGAYTQDAYYQVGASYGSLLAVSVQQRDYQRNLAVGEGLSRTQQVAQIRTTLGSQVARLTAEAQWGRVLDRATDTATPLARYRLGTTLRLNAAIQITGDGSYEAALPLYTTSFDRRTLVMAGLHLNVRHGATSNLRLGVRHSRDRFEGRDALSRTFATLDVEQTLPWNHQFAFQCSYQLFDGGQGFTTHTGYFQFAYRIPLNIRLHRSRQSGAIAGILRDRETNLGLVDVPVYIENAAALTNDDGAFFLSAVEPGIYQLYVDGTKLGRNQRLVGQNNVAVEVKGGAITDVALEATRAAEITGRIRRVSAPHIEGIELLHTADRSEEALGGVLLELSGPEGTTRQVSSGDGQFRFGFLAPGTYTLRVLQESLPSYHRVDVETISFTLDAGASEVAEYYVYPEKRQLRLIAAQPITLKAGETTLPLETGSEVAIDRITESVLAARADAAASGEGEPTQARQERIAVAVPSALSPVSDVASRLDVKPLPVALPETVEEEASERRQVRMLVSRLYNQLTTEGIVTIDDQLVEVMHAIEPQATAAAPQASGVEGILQRVFEDVRNRGVLAEPRPAPAAPRPAATPSTDDATRHLLRRVYDQIPERAAPAGETGKQPVVNGKETRKESDLQQLLERLRNQQRTSGQKGQR